MTAQLGRIQICSHSNSNFTGVWDTVRHIPAVGQTSRASRAQAVRDARHLSAGTACWHRRCILQTPTPDILRPDTCCRATASATQRNTSTKDSSSTSSGGNVQDRGPPSMDGFDLSLAVALAAAAFEAYLEPSGADGFQERTLNGTEVTYTDRHFLQEHFDGVLQLTIKSARGLKAINITSGDSDPYVLASVGDSCSTTTTKWGTLDPVWDETHTLYVTNRETDNLRLRLFDKGGALFNLQSDKDLGAVVVPLAALEDGQEMELELKGPDAQGSITISSTFLPFSDSAQGKAALDAATNTTDLVLPGAAATAAVVAAAVEEEWTLQGPLGGGGDGSDDGLESRAKEAVQAALQQAVQLLPQDAHLDPAKLQHALAVAGDAALGSAAAYAERVGQQLADAGVDAKTIEGIMRQAKEAADGVQRFMSGGALGSVPIGQLKKLLAAIGAGGSTSSEQSSSGDSSSNNRAGASSADAQRAASTSSTDGGVQQQEGQQQEEGQTTALQQLEQAHLPGAWKALASIAGRVIDESLVPIAYLENKHTDTQCWVYRNEEQREVVVAFRGTEQVKWKDFISDLNFIPTSLDEERTGVSSILPFAAFKKNTDIMVHSGFLNAYDSVRVKLLRLIDALTPPPPGSSDNSSNNSSNNSSDSNDSSGGSNTAQNEASTSNGNGHGSSASAADGNTPSRSDGGNTGDASGSSGSRERSGMGPREWFTRWWSSTRGGKSHREQQPWRVYITGHSLGGALATLCAYELAGRRKPHQHVAMYTYGSPRVGNAAFSDAFNARVTSAWRFYNASDIVPSVPRLMGYSHVRHGVRLTGEGGLQFEESSKDVLGEGREMLEVLQELANKAVGVAQGQASFDSVMEELKQHEMEIFYALVDGSALAQHMEDYYLRTLKECVLLADPSLEEQFEEAIAEVVATTPVPGASAKETADAQDANKQGKQ